MATQEPNGSDTSRLDRIERNIEALTATAAAFFAQAAEQNARMAEQNARMAEIQARHGARLNDHEEVMAEIEADHRRLLRAQVLIADELRETAALARDTEKKLNALVAVVDDLIRRQPKQ